MFKYEIENELKTIAGTGIRRFRKHLDKTTEKLNKIILFKNKKDEYSCYYCTKCKKWHFLKTKELMHFNKGDYLICGNCRTRLEIIYRNNKIDDFCDYITLIENNYRSELIIRLFFYKRTYDKKYGQFYEEFYEVERINLDYKIAMKNNSYKVMGSWSIYHGPTRKGWIRDRNGFYQSYYYDNVYNCQKDIKKIIGLNREWKYSCLDLAVKNNLDVLSYLKLYRDYPKVELLMKTGCTKIVKEICKDSIYLYNPHILNKLDKKGINMLRKYNLSYKETEMYIKTHIEDHSILKKGVSVGYLSAGMNHDVIKTINYIYEKKYNISDYEDYLHWCDELGMNLRDKKVLYPDEPKKGHDDVFKEKLKYEENKYDEEIRQYSKELERFIFEEKGMIIKPAKSQSDLIYESKILEHCVRSYAERMAKRKTSIFFIRKKEKQDTPFVTLELKNSVVIQCRGYKNNIKEPLDENVKLFVNDWCKKNHFQTCFG